MLPTQFIPEYYRDAKDILWAEPPEEKPDKPGKRRSLFVRIRNRLRRKGHASEAGRKGRHGEIAY